MRIEFGQTPDVTVDHRDLSAHAGCDKCRVPANNAATDDHDLAWRHTRHPAQQNPASAMWIL